MGLCSQFILNEGTNNEEIVIGFKRQHYWSHNGDSFSGNGVGYHLDTSGIQYPDNWGVNMKLTVKTDFAGASKISISGLTFGWRNVKGGVPLRLAVKNTDSRMPETPPYVTMNLDGTGSIDVKLSPNTIYYVWLYCGGYSDMYYADNVIVSASGTYGAAAQVNASDSLFGSTIPISLFGSAEGATYTVSVSYGLSITGVVNKYLASAGASGVTTSTAGWSASVQSVSASTPYLWNYEIVYYSNNTTSLTDPVIIGTYGHGTAGNAGISSVTEYYAVSNNGVTAPANNDFSTSQPTATTASPYLWNFETVTYSDNTTQNTEKRVIGSTTDILYTDTTATTINWTPDATRVKNSSEVPVTIICVTKYEGSIAGYNTKQITLRYSSSYAPIKTEGSNMVTITASNTGGAAYSPFSDIFVQGYSRAHVKLNKNNISYQSGASLAAFSITYQNNTSSTNSVPPDNTDNIFLETSIIPDTSASILCTVTDSRGLTYSETVTILLSPYATPTLSNASVFRSTSNGVKDEDGSGITSSVSCAYSTISGNNTVTLTLYYKLLSSSTWSTGQTMTLSNSLYSGTVTGLSPDLAYDIKIVALDQIGNTAEFTKQLPTRKWAMKFRPDGNGVAFGKAATYDNELQLPDNWTITFGDQRQDWITRVLNSTRLVFANVNNTDYSISWAEENPRTYAEYRYKATITLTGVTVDHVPQVTFSLADAASGNYAPVSSTDNGHVYIWAKDLPSGTPPSISIPTIECRR